MNSVCKKILLFCTVMCLNSSMIFTMGESDASSAAPQSPRNIPTSLAFLANKTPSPTPEQAQSSILSSTPSSFVAEPTQATPREIQEVNNRLTVLAAQIALGVNAGFDFIQGHYFSGATQATTLSIWINPERTRHAFNSVNKKNCSRGINRCKQWTSWLTLGWYQNPSGKKLQ